MKYFIISFFVLICNVSATRQERRIESEQVEIIIVEESIQPQPQLIDRGLVPQLWQNYTGWLDYYIALLLNLENTHTHKFSKNYEFLAKTNDKYV